MSQAISIEYPSVDLGGFPVQSLTAPILGQKLERAIDEKKQISLFFANTNFVVKCQDIRESILKSNCVITNDGVGLDIASLLLYKKKFPENLCGTDFVPQFLIDIKQKARVFLLGAKPGIADRAAKNMREHLGITVVGARDGYSQMQDIDKVINDINTSEANIVIVAMGNPLQEKWILDHQHSLNANIFMGVGALIDFLAGDKPRAPVVFRKLRLEWLYRLSLEPTRLLRRYTLDIGIFLALCLNAERNKSKWVEKHNEQ
ncbi:MAG: WecB/TagA/CpsF family glycosyltransferase [Gammaproteobacteria bacterium]|nr:MAG: WecB/TagA/CpsF family glycosyltransferase [Gammaproteobacteria bacterium]